MKVLGAELRGCINDWWGSRTMLLFQVKRKRALWEESILPSHWADNPSFIWRIQGGNMTMSTHGEDAMTMAEMARALDELKVKEKEEKKAAGVDGDDCSNTSLLTLQGGRRQQKVLV